MTSSLNTSLTSAFKWCIQFPPCQLEQNINVKRKPRLQGTCKTEPIDVCRGTPGYAAPELCRTYLRLSNESVTNKADIFSVGVTLLETWLGGIPYTSMLFPPPPPNWVDQQLPWESMLIMRWVAQPGSRFGKAPTNPVRDCLQAEHPFVGKLIRSCCQANPRKRPTAAEVAALLRQELTRTEAEQAESAGQAATDVLPVRPTGIAPWQLHDVYICEHNSSAMPDQPAQ